MEWNWYVQTITLPCSERECRRSSVRKTLTLVVCMFLAIASVGLGQANPDTPQGDTVMIGQDLAVEIQDVVTPLLPEKASLAPPRTKPALLYGVCNPSTGQSFDIWLVNDDGTSKTALATSVDDEYALTIIGDRVVYTSFTHERFPKFLGLWSVKLNGTGRMLLLTNPTAPVAQWANLNYAVLCFDDGRCLSSTGTGSPISIPVTGQIVGLSSHFLVSEYYPPGEGQPDLYSTKLDGSVTTVVAASPGDEMLQGFVGNRAIFANYYPAGGSGYRLYSSDLYGQDRPDALSPAGMDSFDPLVVGNRVFFKRGADRWWAPENICYANPDGTGFKQLTTTLAQHTILGVPSGNDRLVFDSYTQNSNSSQSSLQSIRLGGTSLIQLVGSNYQGLTAVFGSRVIYPLTNAADPSLWDFFSVLPSGGTPVPLAVGYGYGIDGYNNALTLDRVSGRCFRSYKRNGQFDVDSILSTGSDRRVIASTSKDESYVFCTVGRVAFESPSSTGEWDLYSADMYGSNRKTMVNLQPGDVPSPLAIILTSGQVIAFQDTSVSAAATRSGAKAEQNTWGAKIVLSKTATKNPATYAEKNGQYPFSNSYQIVHTGSR